MQRCKKYLGGSLLINKKINDKILIIKSMLKSNIEKTTQITDKLDSILIDRNILKTDKKDVNYINKVALKFLNDLIKKIDIIKENTSVNKEIIDELNKYINELNKITAKLYTIIMELQKGFSTPQIKIVGVLILSSTALLGLYDYHIFRKQI